MKSMPLPRHLRIVTILWFGLTLTACNQSSGDSGNGGGGAGAPPAPKPGAEGADCSTTGRCNEGLFCDSNQFPSTCRKRLEVDSGCANDGECASGLFCHDSYLVCRMPGQDGTTCDGVEDCAEGLGCRIGEGGQRVCSPERGQPGRCETDEDCRSPLVCADTYNRCYARRDPTPGQVGWPCGSHGECGEKFACMEDECAQRLGEGQECWQDRQCAEELRCRQDLQPPQCGQPGGAGVSCERSDDCAQGFICNRALEPVQCAERGDQDALCYDDSDCVDGFICVSTDGSRRYTCQRFGCGPGGSNEGCARCVEGQYGRLCAAEQRAFNSCRDFGPCGTVCAPGYQCQGDPGCCERCVQSECAEEANEVAACRQEKAGEAAEACEQ